MASDECRKGNLTMNDRVRAKNLPGNRVGGVRRDLYKRAVERWQDAFAKGFYLECIVITDSMIADRLDARRAYVLGRDVEKMSSSLPIGKALRRLRAEENTNDEKLELALDHVNAWVELRNQAVHRLVKVYENELDKTFEDKIAEYKKTAKLGFDAYRKLSAAVKRLNKY